MSNQKNKILNDLLVEYSSKSHTLPNLKKNLNWWEEFRKEKLAQLDKFFSELFGSTRLPNASFDFASIAEIFLSFIFYSTILLVVYFLLKFLYPFFVENYGTKNKSVLDVNLKNAVDFEDELKKLIESGEYKKALRLRWKIFVKKISQQDSLTPTEFFNLNPENGLFQLDSLNSGMFSYSMPTKDVVRSIDSSLSSFEEKREQKTDISIDLNESDI